MIGWGIQYYHTIKQLSLFNSAHTLKYTCFTLFFFLEKRNVCSLMQTWTLQHDFPHKSCGFSIYALISWNMFNKCPKSYEKQNINKHYRLGYCVLWHRVGGGEVRRSRMALTDEEDMSIFFFFSKTCQFKRN